MNLTQLKRKTARYEAATGSRNILAAVVAQGSREWELTSSVTVGGQQYSFSLPIPTAYVEGKLADKLAELDAELATLAAELGITP